MTIYLQVWEHLTQKDDYDLTTPYIRIYHIRGGQFSGPPLKKSKGNEINVVSAINSLFKLYFQRMSSSRNVYCYKTFRRKHLR